MMVGEGTPKDQNMHLCHLSWSCWWIENQHFFGPAGLAAFHQFWSFNWHLWTMLLSTPQPWMKFLPAAWYSHYLSIKTPINRWLIMLIHHESFSWILPQYLILTIYCTKWDNPPVVFVGDNQPPFKVDIPSRINRYINSRCITMYNHHSL